MDYGVFTFSGSDKVSEDELADFGLNSNETIQRLHLQEHNTMEGQRI
jgi:hypothetical protein